MTFDDWWTEWNQTILGAAGSLASPRQVKLIFKDCYLEGYEQGHTDGKEKKEELSSAG